MTYEYDASTEYGYLLRWRDHSRFYGERYWLLEHASKQRVRPERRDRRQLAVARASFDKGVAKGRYPLSSMCFLCPQYDPCQLIRHHVIALKNWGSNSRFNIVTLCNRCHSYFHPWLDRPENRWIGKDGECEKCGIKAEDQKRRPICSSELCPHCLEIEAEYPLTHLNGQLRDKIQGLMVQSLINDDSRYKTADELQDVVWRMLEVVAANPEAIKELDYKGESQ